jgi:hypothetical protein
LLFGVDVEGQLEEFALTHTGDVFELEAGERVVDGLALRVVYGALELDDDVRLQY